jgi:ribonuclease Z
MSEGSDFRVTLLGTGVPIPSPNRFGPGTLIEAGQQKLLIDTGRGIAMRLFQLGIPLGKINPVFLTHFHSDHTSGFPDLWLTGWLESWFGTRCVPLRVIGPIGTINLTSNIERAYAADIKIRIEDEKLPAEGIAIAAEEFAADGVVYESDGVRVIAFEVDHGDAIKPAYGYRIEYGGRCVVISGDTRYKRGETRYRCRSVDPRRGAAGSAGGAIPAAYHRPSHDAARSRHGVLADRPEACRLHPSRTARKR